jgi:hypothetical protein
MSSNESGTMRHVKGMAAATFIYESERGNTYPRLNITVDYRGPKNIRLRAYDEHHHVVDTIGANDLAEACLLAGLTVRYAETMHARKLRSGADSDPKRSRPPVALRFLDALTLQLRRQKASGAAEVVRTAAGLQFHPTNWAKEPEQRRVLALAGHAARAWTIPALKSLGGEYETMIANQLADLLPEILPLPEDAADAATLLSQVRLPADAGSGPNPITRSAVSRVLHEVALSLRHVGETGDVDSAMAPSLPGDPLARSVEHAAMALAAAFNGGGVTALPPASRQVFELLDRVA